MSVLNYVNKVHCGDSLVILRQIPSNSIGLVVTSPPYADTVFYGKNVKVFSPDNYIEWILPIFKEIKRVLKDDGSFILNINDKSFNGERSIYVFDLIVRVVKELDFRLFDRYIWFKKSALPITGNRRLNDRVEYIFHLVKDVKKFKCYTDRVREPYKEITLRRFKSKMHGNDKVSSNGITSLSYRGESIANPLGKKPITVFRFDTCSALRGIKHPAPYHPDLPKWFINWLTDIDDIVLDPFFGSGSTGVAAKELGRDWIGIDINEQYVKDAMRRLECLS
jgi:DNA modification methylase